MKLWLKIALICAAVLLLIIGTCSTLLLLTARDNIISMTTDSAKTEQHDLAESFKQMMTYYYRNELDETTKRSLVLYSFRTFANETAVLIQNNETIYSNISFDPQSLLPLSEQNTQKDYLGQVKGTNILIVGSKADMLSDTYTIYTVRDITEVYKSISKMIWQFGAISLGCIIAGITLLVILLIFATRPLIELGRSVKRITQGEYTERAKVKTKDEIGDLAKDFNIMAGAVQTHVEALKEITQQQQLFIGGLTHEFKTPLTSVIGHSETLLYTKMPEEAVIRSLNHIHEQCRWLERLTQKLLKLITLQEEVQLKEEPVEALIDAVRESTAETLQKRDMMLETECAISTLPMDMDLMLSLLVNLVDNASKASKPGQTIQISAFGRTIEVKDHGMGIPENELAHITEPFYMVDKSRSKKMGGAGLGLALVQRIANAHGAKIAIESKPGEGTSVKVIFPDNN